MQRLWSRLAVFLGKNVVGVGIVTVILLGIAAFGITRLEFATGQDSYLNTTDEVYIDNVKYQDLFGGQAMLTVITMDEGHSVTELMSDENQAKFVDFTEKVSASDQVKGVITPLSAMQLSDRITQGRDGNAFTSVGTKILTYGLGQEAPGSPEHAAREENINGTLERLNAVPETERSLDNPAWAEFVMQDNDGNIRKPLLANFPDDRHAQIVTRLEGNRSLDDEGAGADTVMAAVKDLTIDNATVTTTGAPLILQNLNDYLRGGMLTLGGIAVAIMFVVLLVFFDVRWRLLPMLVILVGVTLAFGAAGFLGIPLTVVTIAALPVMLGVGIDYAIQMQARIEEEVVLDREEHPIQEAARKLGPALLIVTFDAVFAFLALRFAKVPMIRDFGMLLMVGITVICICSIVLPMAPLGMREYRSPTPPGDYTEGWLGRLVVRLGSLPSSWAVPFAVLSLVVFIAGVAVEGDLTLQTDAVKWVNQDSQVIKDYNNVEKEAKAVAELGIFVQTDDVFDDEFVAWVHDYTQQWMNDPLADGRLITGNSIETLAGDLLAVRGASDIAPTGALVKEIFDLAEPSTQELLVSPDNSAMNVIYRSSAASLEEAKPLVEKIRDDNDSLPNGISATPSGLAVVGIGLLDNLEANRVMLTYLSIAFVGLFLTIRLRSLFRSLLSLVPVLIAVGAASLVAWAFDLVLSPMTAVGGPLVVALCTEFTSLILLRFIEERERGLEPKDAADVAAARTGRAFIVSAMTGVTGVAVLAFSSLPLLRDFGIIVAMNVVVALLSALVILPPMLVWAERRGWVTHGIASVPEEPFIDTPGSASLQNDRGTADA